MFEDRRDAGEQLARALDGYRGRHPLVLAIPRGAVPIGAILARRLGGELDLVLVRKLNAPGAPEFAIGSVDETGWVYLAPHAGSVGATPAYVEEQKAAQLQELARRRERYTPGRTRIDAAGRTVIVVDDGLATGSTMRAAVQAIRQQQPAHVCVAVPVGAQETVERMRSEADEVVCAAMPMGFRAVGLAYEDFPQSTDAEVRTLLDTARRDRSLAAH
jgi:predicted phosphoribosyltransferase